MMPDTEADRLSKPARKAWAARVAQLTKQGIDQAVAERLALDELYGLAEQAMMKPPKRA